MRILDLAPVGRDEQSGARRHSGCGISGGCPADVESPRKVVRGLPAFEAGVALAVPGPHDVLQAGIIGREHPEELADGERLGFHTQF